MFHLSFEVGTRQCKPHVYSLHLQRNTRVVFHTGSVSDTSDRRFDDWIVIDENGVSGFHALVRTIGKVEPDNPRARFGNNPRKIYADIYIDDHNAGGLRLPAMEKSTARKGITKGGLK